MSSQSYPTEDALERGVGAIHAVSTLGPWSDLYTRNLNGSGSQSASTSPKGDSHGNSLPNSVFTPNEDKIDAYAVDSSPELSLPVLPEKAHIDKDRESIVSKGRASIASSLRRRHLAAAKSGARKVGAWLELQYFMTPYRRSQPLNSYPEVLTNNVLDTGKFFIFVVTLNFVGIILTATGHFAYAKDHSGALLLGNLLMAVMMRNELFIRILYLFTNTFLAKVRKSPLHTLEKEKWKKT